MADIKSYPREVHMNEINEIIENLDLVYRVLDRIDVRGYKDRKAVVLAQEILVAECRKLKTIKKEAVEHAEHCDGDGESDAAQP